MASQCRGCPPRTLSSQGSGWNSGSRFRPPTVRLKTGVLTPAMASSNAVSLFAGVLLSTARHWSMAVAMWPLLYRARPGPRRHRPARTGRGPTAAEPTKHGLVVAFFVTALLIRSRRQEQEMEADVVAAAEALTILE